MPTAIWTCAWQAWTTRASAVLWRNEGGGKFVGRTRRWPTASSRPASATWTTTATSDLWLGRAGADRVLLNDGKGKFSPAELRGAGRPGRTDAHRPAGRSGQRRRSGLPGLSAEQGRCSRWRPSPSPAAVQRVRQQRRRHVCRPGRPVRAGLQGHGGRRRRLRRFRQRLRPGSDRISGRGEARRLGQRPSGRASAAGRGGNGPGGAKRAQRHVGRSGQGRRPRSARVYPRTASGC